jgi:hypothetical protein
MMTKRGINSLMIAVAAVFLIFAMAMPVMADRYGTFQGTITKSGQLVTSHGSQYWLTGPHSSAIENHVGQKVEIKGLLRQNTGDPYSLGPTIEVYSYEWMNGMNSNYMNSNMNSDMNTR